MKQKLIFILTVLAAALSPAIAQNAHNHGLVLRGVYSEWVKSEHKDYLCWKAKLAMEFVNQGTEPIILIDDRNRNFGPWRSHAYLSANLLTRSGEMEQFDWSTDLWGPCTLDYKYWLERNELFGIVTPIRTVSAAKYDLETPQQNLTIIIEPGRSVFFNDVLYVGQKVSTEKLWGRDHKILEGPSMEINSGPWQDGIPISWYDRIRIKYQFTFSKKESILSDEDELPKLSDEEKRSKRSKEIKKDDRMQSLQLRWRKFGYLPVDDDGGFSITSEELRKN